MKRLIAILAAAFVLCVARPAAASFLYDFVGFGTHEQFTVPSLLTSATTVTSFSLASPNVIGLVLDPVAAGQCVGRYGDAAPGPCAILEQRDSGGQYTVGLIGFPVFTTVGVYNSTPGNNFSGTITISAVSVPEPATLALLGLGLSALVSTRRRKSGNTLDAARRGRRWMATCHPMP